MNKVKRPLHIRLLRIVGWIIGILVFLVLAITLLLQTQWAQEQLRGVAVNYLEKKLKTKVSIGSIRINWLYNLELDKVYFEDQQKKPLLYLGKLEASYRLLDLLNGKLTVHSVAIDSLYANVYRSSGSTQFNFSYIADAFGDTSAPTTPDTLSSGTTLQWNLGKLELNRVNLHFDDQQEGQEYQLTGNSIATKIRKFDLEKQLYEVDYFETLGLNAKVRFSKSGTDATDTTTASTAPQGPAPNIRLGKILLKQTAFVYEDVPGAIKTNTYAGILDIKESTLDLTKYKLNVQTIRLTDHFTGIATGTAQPKITTAAKPVNTAFQTKNTIAKAPATPDTSVPFRFNIGKIIIERNEFKMDDNTTPRLPQQLDYGHLFLKDLFSGISGIEYDGNNYKATIDSLRTREQSGFVVNRLAGKITYSDKGIKWEEGQLATNKNDLRAGLDIAYDSIGQFTSHPDRVILNATISEARIMLDDLLYIMPELSKNEYVRPLLGKTFVLHTTIKGRLNNFTIPDLTIKEGATNLKANAVISGLPDADKLRIDLNLKEFSGTRSGLLGWLPKGLIPDNIQLPERFTLRGSYKGTMDDMQTDLVLQTSAGNISLKGKIKNIADPKNASYDLATTTQSLNLGYLLKDTTFGKADLTLNVSGKGMDPKTADAAFSGNIGTFKASGYTYSKIDFKGGLKNQLLSADLTSADPNLQTDITLRYSLDSTRPVMQTSLTAGFIDFKALGLTTDAITLKGKIDADFQNANPDQLQGALNIHELQIGNEGVIYPLDSISIVATRDSDIQHLTIHSPFLIAELSGKYQLTKLAGDAAMLVERYRSDRPDTIILPVNGQQATLTGTLYYPKIAAAFIPEWKLMTPANLSGSINSSTGELSFATSIQQTQYADYTVDSLTVDIKGKNDSLDYYVGINRLINPSFPLYKTKVKGSMQHNKLLWTVETDDSENKPKYRLNGAVITQDKKTILQLSPGILLNAEAWTVNPDNQIVFEDGGLVGGNLQLLQNEHKISVTTGPNGVPVNMSFTSFPLASIAGIIETDTALVEGYLNGSIIVPQLNPFTFTADLKIDSLKGMGYPVGELTAKVNSKEEGIYNMNIGLGGNGNNVSVDGWYNAKDSGSMSAKISLAPLNISSFQSFINTFIDSAKGNINGNLTISGTPSLPEIRGSLKTNKVSMVYRDYNTFIQLPNETIVFDDKGVLLNELVVTDRSGDEAVINGRVYTTDYLKYRFDLSLKAQNFLAVNERLSPEQWVYGPAYIDADLTIKGDMDLPQIDGDVKLRDNSELTVVIKEDDPGLEDRKGIITFVDKDNPPDSALIRKQAILDSLAQTKISGISMSVNAEITPKSTFTIILDEDNGDYLKVKGTATLNTTIDASGKTSITGRYMVDEGEYQLSLNQLIKRNFKIVKGGTIIWNGDPTSATLDLSAVYELNTTAYTLIKDVVSSDNTAAVRQRLPFQVYLNIKGEMLQPDISFQLDMPERDRNVFDGAVYTRLKQININPSELNKQVMGLLVLNNFIADNPFTSLDNNFTGDLQSTARKTAGKILGQQLNNLLGGMIKGVDLNFDVESKDDFSSGSSETQTDLKIGMSKNLFNDRTTVTVGSSVGLEGKNNASSLAGDVEIEYKISRDGRYRLKLYRRNNDEAVIEGQVVETGVSFILLMDYNSFREILQRARDEKIMRKRKDEEEPKN